MAAKTQMYAPLFHLTSKCYIHRGHIAVLGGVLIHLSLGTLYTFGNLLPYLASYMASKNGNSKSAYDDYTDSLAWVYACMTGGQAIMIAVGGKFEHYFGPSVASLIGGWIMSLGVAMTYFACHNFGATLFTYGICFGCGIGIAYPSSLVCGMKWFEQSKGLINGIILFGFGTGAFVFDQGCIYAVMQLIGAILLKHPPNARIGLMQSNPKSTESAFTAILFDENNNNVNNSTTATSPKTALNRSFAPAPAQSIANDSINSTKSNNETNEETKKKSSDVEIGSLGDNEMNNSDNIDIAGANQTKQQQKLQQIKNIKIDSLENAMTSNDDSNDNLKLNNQLQPAFLFGDKSFATEISWNAVIEQQGTSSILVEYDPKDNNNTNVRNSGINRVQTVETQDFDAIDTIVTNTSEIIIAGNNNETGKLNASDYVQLRDSKSPELKDLKDVMQWNVKDVLQSVEFWQLWANFLFNGMCVTFVSTQWKEMSNQHLNISNDDYLSVMGAVSSLFNGSGRILWGTVLDRSKSYRFTMGMLGAVMTVFLFFWPLLNIISKNDVYIDIASIIWLCVLFLCAGGNFAIFPTQVTHTFGKENNGVNLGLVFSSQLPANWAAIFAFEYVRKRMGYIWMSWVMSVVSFVGLLVGISYKQPKTCNIEV